MILNRNLYVFSASKEETESKSTTVLDRHCVRVSKHGKFQLLDGHCVWSQHGTHSEAEENCEFLLFEFLTKWFIGF